CPEGKKVMGSGWGLLGAYVAESGDIDQNSMYWNEPMAAGDGWHFQVAGDFSGPVRTYELYIFCADV
ncbi:MAG TPA: hypothetical protein VJ978_10485, partial [Nitriliruptoraceae bacterium]|nr:hypothetical protein [Nitriliruptoraceae bacterium]